MSFELSIALRYLKTRRHGLFALVTTLIAIGGVTLGVAALIVTLSVMNGFRADIQNKTLGIQPHVILLGTEKDPEVEISALEDKLSSVPDVKAVSPFILGQILLKSERYTQGVVARGIVPSKEFQVTQAEKSLISGSWSEIASDDQEKKFVVLGKELAHNLSLSVGDLVYVVSPTESAQLGAMASVPKMEKFFVGGVFQSGMYEYDANMAFLSIVNARELFGLEGATGIGLKTADLEDADAVAKKVGEAAGAKYWARSWQEMNRNLFSALKLEKVVMTIILTMIILVASFTIISNLILMSIEKSRDIGILKALGASQRSIRKIFLYAGMTLGGAGVVLGSLLGVGIVLILDKTKWIKLPADVYYVDTLPVQLSFRDISLVLIAAFLITMISAVYPASQAAKVNPVEAIRYG